MKHKRISLYLGLLSLGLCTALQAQDAAEGAEVEEKVIPTEVSEPPYEVGDLVTEQGYYIEREEDQTLINFRIVDNRARLYWIDADGLIAEPEAEAATVRLTGNVRMHSYYRMSRLSDDAGLGSPLLMPPPHIFSVTLIIEDPESDAGATQYSFRYLSKFDQAVDPTASASEAESEPEAEPESRY